jgi:hypothetical protein
MKTRRLAMALENERVGERSDHAAGLVSRMMDKRDGDCSGYLVRLGHSLVVVVVTALGMGEGEGEVIGD